MNYNEFKREIEECLKIGNVLYKKKEFGTNRIRLTLSRNKEVLIGNIYDNDYKFYGNSVSINYTSFNNYQEFNEKSIMLSNFLIFRKIFENEENEKEYKLLQFIDNTQIPTYLFDEKYFDENETQVDRYLNFSGKSGSQIEFYYNVLKRNEEGINVIDEKIKELWEVNNSDEVDIQAFTEIIENIKSLYSYPLLDEMFFSEIECRIISDIIENEIEYTIDGIKETICDTIYEEKTEFIPFINNYHDKYQLKEILLRIDYLEYYRDNLEKILEEKEFESFLFDKISYEGHASIDHIIEKHFDFEEFYTIEEYKKDNMIDQTIKGQIEIPF